MGNSQSTPPNTNLPPGSRRFGSPRPRTSSSANPDLQSPRRSSSLRATMPRPSSPSSSVQSAHVTHTSSLRSPRSPGVRSGRSRLSSDSKDREKEKEKEREKEGRRYVHRSLRTKKKSLELPDLASLNVTQVAHAIPNVLSDSPTQDTPPSNENGDAEDPEDTVTDDAVTEDIDPETGFRRMIIRSTMPFPPNLQQTLVSRALAQAATSSSTTSSTAVTRSTTSSKIPSGQRINPRASEGETTYLVKISWHGGGSEVFLTRAGDDDWAGKRVMEQETIVAEESVSGSSDTQAQGSQPGPTFSTIIALPRGTHHLRFIVDGQNRVADDLPTAVDDNGSLANYVSVGLGDMSPSEGAGANPVLVPLSDAILNVREGGNAEGDAEFIIEGEVDSDAILRQPDIIQSSGPASVLIERIERRASHSSFWSEHDNDSDTAQTRPPSLSSSPSGAGLAGARAGLGMTPATDAAANSHSNTTPTKPKPRKPYTPQWTCDNPLELLEAAAEEEAYLAYSNEVENARSSNQRIHITGFVPLPNIPPAPRQPRHLEKLILNAPPPIPRGSPSPSGSRGPSANASPRIGSGNMAGIGSGLNGVGERTSRDAREREREREREMPSSPLREGYSPEGREGRRRERDREREREWKSMSMALALADEAAEAEPSRPLPVTTASGTNVTTDVRRPGSPPLPPPPSSPRTSQGTQTTQPTQSTVDATLTAVDDTSVLPVPSHAVLHHLCTSAIRDGVLAVGETVRYRKKFVTSIYYKPTS